MFLCTILSECCIIYRSCYVRNNWQCNMDLANIKPCTKETLSLSERVAIRYSLYWWTKFLTSSKHSKMKVNSKFNSWFIVIYIIVMYLLHAVKVFNRNFDWYLVHYYEWVRKFIINIKLIFLCITEMVLSFSYASIYNRANI